MVNATDSISNNNVHEIFDVSALKKLNAEFNHGFGEQDLLLEEFLSCPNSPNSVNSDDDSQSWNTFSVDDTSNPFASLEELTDASSSCFTSACPSLVSSPAPLAASARTHSPNFNLHNNNNDINKTHFSQQQQMQPTSPIQSQQSLLSTPTSTLHHLSMSQNDTQPSSQQMNTTPVNSSNIIASTPVTPQQTIATTTTTTTTISNNNHNSRSNSTESTMSLSSSTVTGETFGNGILWNTAGLEPTPDDDSVLHYLYSRPGSPDMEFAGIMPGELDIFGLGLGNTAPAAVSTVHPSSSFSQQLPPLSEISRAAEDIKIPFAASAAVAAATAAAAAAANTTALSGTSSSSLYGLSHLPHAMSCPASPSALSTKPKMFNLSAAKRRASADDSMEAKKARARQTRDEIVAKTIRTSKADNPELRRITHNVLERKRREDLKVSYQELRVNVPELQHNERAPTGQILAKAVEYINQLKREDEEIVAKLEALRAENLRLRQIRAM